MKIGYCLALILLLALILPESRCPTASPGGQDEAWEQGYENATRIERLAQENGVAIVSGQHLPSYLKAEKIKDEELLVRIAREQNATIYVLEKKQTDLISRRTIAVYKRYLVWEDGSGRSLILEKKYLDPASRHTELTEEEAAMFYNQSPMKLTKESGKLFIFLPAWQKHKKAES